jgi:CheY-like chemotaxis protein
MVESGQKALKELQSRRFDAILADIHMPEMNGFELVQQVKQLYKGISIYSKFIFIFKNNIKF